jgi:hypothetical protein
MKLMQVGEGAFRDLQKIRYSAYKDLKYAFFCLDCEYPHVSVNFASPHENYVHSVFNGPRKNVNLTLIVYCPRCRKSAKVRLGCSNFKTLRS